jgi:hypothetical protein
LQNHIADLIHQQSIALDYAFYELAEYYDRLHRARSEAGLSPAGFARKRREVFCKTASRS